MIQSSQEVSWRRRHRSTPPTTSSPLHRAILVYRTTPLLIDSPALSRSLVPNIFPYDAARGLPTDATPTVGRSPITARPRLDRGVLEGRVEGHHGRPSPVPTAPSASLTAACWRPRTGVRQGGTVL